MKITFLTPGYNWGPSGGIRVVYEYANRLVFRGHQVAVVHPRQLKYPPPRAGITAATWLRTRLRNARMRMRATPIIDWQPIDKRVEMLFVPDSGPRHVPDGDAIFATGWTTVRSVSEMPQVKGEKCYLIQGYESYHAPKDLVDATWRAPLHKIVVAKWLVELGRELGCPELTYIPNAIDHRRYRILRPIEGRPRQVSMVFSSSQVKGSTDGIEAMRIARERFPDLKVVLFGTSPARSAIPEWAEYFQNPPQEYIIDKIYNNSQVFVGSSWMEGFSLPQAEAAACGCSVATTDSLGVREYIEHGVTGLLSPIKDPAALAENICRLLNDEALRVQLATACNRLISTFNWEHSADLFENFLCRVMENKKSSNEPVLSSAVSDN